MKEFFPDVEYNKAKRRKTIPLFALIGVLIGGGGVACFLTEQTTFGIICIFFLAMLAFLIPAILSSNPVKPDAIIKFEGKKVTLYGKETISVSDVIAVSVCIEVPKQGTTRNEMQKALKDIASVKPEEPVFGTCDLVIRNAKGKEEQKYHYVQNCLGALEAFVEAGVKQYRIMYTMNKLNELATYPIVVTPSGNTKYDSLSEKERLMQLL